MFWNGSMGGWGYGLMGLTMVLFWALIIAGIVALVRTVGRAPRDSGFDATRPPPQRLLAERFARGDIDEDEYQRRLDALNAAGSGAGG